MKDFEVKENAPCPADMSSSPMASKSIVCAEVEATMDVNKKDNGI